MMYLQASFGLKIHSLNLVLKVLLKVMKFQSHGQTLKVTQLLKLKKLNNNLIYLCGPCGRIEDVKLSYVLLESIA